MQPGPWRQGALGAPAIIVTPSVHNASARASAAILIRLTLRPAALRAGVAALADAVVADDAALVRGADDAPACFCHARKRDAKARERDGHQCDPCGSQVFHSSGRTHFARKLSPFASRRQAGSGAPATRECAHAPMREKAASSRA